MRRSRRRVASVEGAELGGLIRVSVGCEDVDDLIEDVALELSFVG